MASAQQLMARRTGGGGRGGARLAGRGGAGCGGAWRGRLVPRSRSEAAAASAAEVEAAIFRQVRLGWPRVRARVCTVSLSNMDSGGGRRIRFDRNPFDRKLTKEKNLAS